MNHMMSLVAVAILIEAMDVSLVGRIEGIIDPLTETDGVMVIVIVIEVITIFLVEKNGVTIMEETATGIGDIMEMIDGTVDNKTEIEVQLYPPKMIYMKKYGDGNEKPSLPIRGVQFRGDHPLPKLVWRPLITVDEDLPPLHLEGTRRRLENINRHLPLAQMHRQVQPHRRNERQRNSLQFRKRKES